MYEDEDEPQVDVTKLRYVLYARKSTDDPQRQIRSIGDQIDECELLARVGAINLEQLDVLLESLKTYWDYNSQQGLLTEMRAMPADGAGAHDASLYEL